MKTVIAEMDYEEADFLDLFRPWNQKLYVLKPSKQTRVEYHVTHP